jgi:5-methyltetrahydropteroyltriglutamate--homocysteine methyltransferase
MPTDRSIPSTLPRAALNATVLGYPRIGRSRELKKATEAFWAGELTTSELLGIGAGLRARTWRELASAGITRVPVNDFSFYDHVADTIQLVGAVPDRHRVNLDPTDLAGLDPRARTVGRDEVKIAEYFAMARGLRTAAPLEMTKWFDTNYHYLIPELTPDSLFHLGGDKPFTEAREAQQAGLDPRPVLLGPVTFLELSKPGTGCVDPGWRPLRLLERLLPVYEQILLGLVELGVEWVQLDEPVLAADPDPEVVDAAKHALAYLASPVRRPNLLVATYFGPIGAALPMLQEAPIEGVAIDFTGPAEANLALLIEAGGLPGKQLVAGVVDGRNVWANDLAASQSTLRALCPWSDKLIVSTSCSLRHVPLDLTAETTIPEAVRPWLAFAAQKVDEVTLLATAIRDADVHTHARIAASRRHHADRCSSPLTRNEAVRNRLAALTEDDLHRPEPATERAAAQQARFRLPLLPTTTIGSFPQTGQLRAARADLRTGRITPERYRERIAAEIEHVVTLQDQLGLDVLVHGEPERNDMVQYFAEHLAGFLTTELGWVQSYGTRYVRPPILVGDVARTAPITIDWARYAQQFTAKPVKGMLTGPITMLAWSFVRDDQPLADTARQIALALRDEVADLQAAGIGMIQIDEPGLRELLPLQTRDQPAYLRWAAEAFRLASSGARGDTQIHTHMCYAEFDDIAAAIADLDIDVISLEAARSHSRISTDLAEAGSVDSSEFPGLSVQYAIGPGVYDVHSPRVPSTDQIIDGLRQALDYIPASRLWVNPDCGLKTRTEAEATQALRNIVAAARALRVELPAPSGDDTHDEVSSHANVEGHADELAGRT